MTFDDILPAIKEILVAHADALKGLEWLLINRDLNGRVRLIAPETVQEEEAAPELLEWLAVNLAERLGPHAYPPASAILYETDRELACQGAATVPLEGHANVWVVDRLATESNWAQIAPETQGPRRIVFFSIKGGVGRSTALAATAWWLAQAGRRVLVLDLDLESPGLSSSLLPPDRQPRYGITDWLVEDLVDNGDVVFESMIATSGLSHDGEIYVVPAHGADPGEYVPKLGRVWMPKIQPDGARESWSSRLHRLLQALEGRIRPDVVLIDSRAGIDEVASACVTDLGANLVLLFALEGSQTWSGYRILFEHWRRAGVAESVRERLQLVAATTPDTEGRLNYLETLRENGYDLFAASLYDEIQAGEAIGDRWHFEAADEAAPHAPWEVRWHPSFAGLRSLHGRLKEIDANAVRAIFGPLIDGIAQTVGLENVHD
jgi:hypothetical protein